jgi:heme A synthase
MTSRTSARAHRPVSTGDSQSRLVFSALTGLAALAVVLQGVWAGLFIQYQGAAHQAERDSWIGVHARGGEVAIALAVLATIWAILRLRSRPGLVIGAAVLTVLLVVVAFIGGLITEDGKDVLTPLHIPLAMLTLATVVWLTLRAVRPRTPQ